MNFGENVIEFHKILDFGQPLPDGIKVMNPYQNNPEVFSLFQTFYTKFFSDQRQRKLLVGINPGRLGAGITGIPFTDTKRLEKECGITPPSFSSHEPSSVFVYDFIKALGGPKKFYQSFYINSVCPLGFLRKNKKGNWVNCNYYDDSTLFKVAKPFIIRTLKKQLDFGIDPSVCFSLGKKNAKFLKRINTEVGLFKKVVALPHPRYVMQYKYKTKDEFVKQYTEALNTVY